MCFCTKCKTEFNPRGLEGRTLHLTPEMKIVDQDEKVVGCQSCLGDYFKGMEDYIESIHVKNGAFSLDFKKPSKKHKNNPSSIKNGFWGHILGDELISKRTLKMFVWPIM